LDRVRAVHGDRLQVLHGGASRGVDALADSWCLRNGVAVERHLADWSGEGKRAGPMRNAAMVATGPDVCLAFIRYGSLGARNCAELAERSGVPTIRQEIPVPADVISDIHSGQYGIVAQTDRVVIFDDDRQARHCAEEDVVSALVAGRYAVARGDRHAVTCRLEDSARTVLPLQLTAQGRQWLPAGAVALPQVSGNRRNQQRAGFSYQGTQFAPGEPVPGETSNGMTGLTFDRYGHLGSRTCTACGHRLDDVEGRGVRPGCA
jgi:hypothetical protein